MRELYGQDADGSGAAMDEHVLSAFETGSREEALPRRQARDGHHGSLLVIERRRRSFSEPQYFITIAPTAIPTTEPEPDQPIWYFGPTDTPTSTPLSFPVSPTITHTPANTPTPSITPTATWTPPICNEYQDLVIQDNPRVYYRMNDLIGTLFVRDWMNRDDGLVPGGDATTVELPKLTQGCYEGTGGDDRWIPVGLTNPGLLIVQKKGSAFVTGQNASYWIPQFGDASDFSCMMVNGTPQCTTNRIQAINTEVGAFQLGTDSIVNQDGVVYCYSWWQLGDNHGTFDYEGDGTNPRTVELPVQPDFAAVQIPEYPPFTGPFGSGNLYTRQIGQPALRSYGWFNVGEGPRLNVLRDLVPTGIEVGIDANDTGKTYRGWWFKGSAEYGGAISWVDDGALGHGRTEAVPAPRGVPPQGDPRDAAAGTVIALPEATTRPIFCGRTITRPREGRIASLRHSIWAEAHADMSFWDYGRGGGRCRA